MSQNQAGKWIIAHKPGLHIARDIARGINKAIEDGVKAADPSHHLGVLPAAFEVFSDAFLEFLGDARA